MKNNLLKAKQEVNNEAKGFQKKTNSKVINQSNSWSNLKEIGFDDKEEKQKSNTFYKENYCG